MLQAQKKVIIGAFEAQDHILQHMRSNLLVLLPLLFDVHQFTFLLVVANGVLSGDVFAGFLGIIIGMSPHPYLVGVAALLHPGIVKLSAPVKHPLQFSRGVFVRVNTVFERFNTHRTLFLREERETFLVPRHAMHCSKDILVVFLDIESAYGPGSGFADAAYFLFDKRSKLADQNLLTIFGTPDKVVGHFVGDVFGVLCLHTRQYNKRSHLLEEPIGAALPLLEREGDAAALTSRLSRFRWDTFWDARVRDATSGHFKRWFYIIIGSPLIALIIKVNSELINKMNDGHRNNHITHTSVIIVGAGPTGLMLGNLLGMAGVETLMLWRNADLGDCPIAIALDAEGLRVCPEGVL